MIRILCISAVIALIAVLSHYFYQIDSIPGVIIMFMIVLIIPLFIGNKAKN